MDGELSRLLDRDAQRVFGDAGLPFRDIEEPPHPLMVLLESLKASYAARIEEQEKRHAEHMARAGKDLEAVREANRKAEVLAEESRAALAKQLAEEKAKVGRLEQEVRDERAMREAARQRLEGEIAARASAEGEAKVAKEALAAIQGSLKTLSRPQVQAISDPKGFVFEFEQNGAGRIIGGTATPTVAVRRS
jgi:hypothetical protein